MAVVVFDADVLIAYLNRDDAHHEEAVGKIRNSVEPGTRRLISAVNYSEVLIGPLTRLGANGVATVDGVLKHLGIETVDANPDLARRAAIVRVETKLKLPDAYALATALDAEARSHVPVAVESFDKKVIAALESLR